MSSEGDDGAVITARERAATPPRQLELPFLAPGDDVRVYRRRSWPEGAPDVGVCRLAGARLLQRLRIRANEDRRLPRPAAITITANRRVSMTVKRSGRRAYEIRTHWRILLDDDARLATAVEEVIRNGSFPKDVFDWLDGLARGADDSGHYSFAGRRHGYTDGNHVDLQRLLGEVAQLLPEPGRADEHRKTTGNF